MAQASIVDVSDVIERQPIGRFTLGLIVASWLVTFFDGYDMTVISFTNRRIRSCG